jgi:hypothetical protein
MRGLLANVIFAMRNALGQKVLNHVIAYFLPHVIEMVSNILESSERRPRSRNATRTK